MTCAWALPALIFSWGTANPAAAVPDYLVTFRTTYPAAVGSRIDSCNLCHRNIPQLNPYGHAFKNANQTYPPIESLDSDGDGATNVTEIGALTFPGDPNDAPLSPTPTPTAPATTPTATATTAVEVCTCDCTADLLVTVDELLKAVNIALGTAAVDVCLAADRDGNSAVTIDEILAGVTAALNGCE